MLLSQSLFAAVFSLLSVFALLGAAYVNGGMSRKEDDQTRPLDFTG